MPVNGLGLFLGRRFKRLSRMEKLICITHVHEGHPEWFGSGGCGGEQPPCLQGSIVRVVSPNDSYLVDPASSHMLVSKIKPCMSKYKQFCTVKLRMAH